MTSPRSRSIVVAALLLVCSAGAIDVLGATPTTTTVSSSINPSIVGQPVTFTATVSGSGATGNVTFHDGARVLGTVPLSPDGRAELFVDGTVLGAGQHSITATYSGDATFSASTSEPLIQTVERKPSATTVFAGPNPSMGRDPVTFQVRVGPNPATGAFMGSPSGSVTLFENGSVLAVVPLDQFCGNLSRCGTFTTSTLTPGTRTITAEYSGSSIFAPSTSDPFTHTVEPRVAFVHLSSSLNPSTEGQSVTFTGTMSRSDVTGTVTFYDDGNPLGTAPISGGTASITTSTLTAGSHTITASYSGDAYTSPNPSSAPITQTVESAALATTITVSTAPNPSQSGQTFMLTALVTPSAATGTVSFSANGLSLGTVPVTNGKATLSTADQLPPGTYAITATYSGDANHRASTSAPVTHTVLAAIPTTTQLASSRNPAIAGQSVTFTATVSGSGATGIVQFFSENRLLGTATLQPTGIAELTTILPPGTHTIIAVYSGDTAFRGSESPAVMQVVEARGRRRSARH